MKETIIFTCITNRKDNLLLVQREPGVRYVCFSDQQFKHPVWEWMPADTYGLSDPRRVARMYKILSHVWFPDQTTIWVDGRVRLLKPVSHYLEKYKGLICARRHHDRDNIKEEAQEILRINYDDPRIVRKHMERLTEIPEGLHETGMLLRRGGRKVERFNNMWWSLLSTGSKRDQLSFDYTAHQLGINITDVDRGEVQVLRHKRQTNATF